MPQYRMGDMWTAYPTADLFLITTYSTLRRDGALVMGRGIARQARDRFPGLDRALGRQIQGICGSLGVYGLLISPRWQPGAGPGRLGCFQVKQQWQRPASLTLIRRSAAALTWWARYHANCQIHLNFPGIGNGGLDKTAVLPLLADLPENVTLWELAPQPG